jgi:high affinity choline transporter 7
MAALAYQGWTPPQRAVIDNDPSMTLPMMLRDMVPYAAGVLGLGAIVGAVTSSFSASILSAGSMFSWNVYRRLLAPKASVARLRAVIRGSILVLGAGAALMAFSGRSVAALWFFTADLVYVLLFPQLVMAMFDPRANRAGSVTAFVVSLVLRAGGGIPLLFVPAFIPYPEWFGSILPGEPSDWYDAASGEMLFPVKTLSAAAGLALLPLVSRLSARWDRPRILAKVE